MNTHEFQETLDRAGLDGLARVIDWIERPWAPTRNDALRALLHAARRDPEAKGPLRDGILREILELRPSEMRHVARSLACADKNPSTHHLLLAITARLEMPASPTRAPIEIDALVGSVINLAGRVLAAALRDARPPRHRAGGRRRHGG